MHGATLRRSDVTGALGAFALGALALLGATAAYAVGNGSYGVTAIIVAIIATPAVLFVVLRWPYLLPYGLYVALIPLDNLLLLGSGGTLTKILGMASGITLAVALIRRRRFIPPSRSSWLWFALVAWLAASLLWSHDVASGQRDAFQFVSLVLLFAVLSAAPLDERELRTVCACIVAGGVVAALYGIYLFHDPSYVNDPDGDGRLVINVAGHLIDPNHYANSLLLPLALAVVALSRARHPFAILSLLGCVASIGTVIALTASREAMFGAVLVLATIVVLSRRRWVAAMIMISGVLAAPLLFPVIFLRLQEAVVEQGSGRNYIWRVVWLSIQQHPLFGWGVGSAVTAYDTNYLAVSAPRVDHWDMPPHNTALYVTLELGVVGIVLWLAAYVGTFLQLRRIRADRPVYDLRVALTAAFIGLSFVSLFIDLMNYKYLWLLFGTIVQLRTVARSYVLKPASGAQPTVVATAVERVPGAA